MQSTLTQRLSDDAISPLKVAFLCPSLSRTSFGIFETERRLAQCLRKLRDTEVEVFGPTDEHFDCDRAQWSPIDPRSFKAFGPSSFRYSPGLRDHFLKCDADVAHLHSLWMYHSVVLARWSAKRKKPYIISTNGMLDPWAARNSFWKKQIALLLYQRRSLEGAACTHVSTCKEADSVRNFGLRGNICIIPNGVDLPRPFPYTAPNHASWSLWKAHGGNVLLYLGRIHPKKGLESLVKGWSASHMAKARNWRLVIVGSDGGQYQAQLKRLITQLGQGDRVDFLPPMFAELRDVAFTASDAFVLPSFSEGLPMALLSAWASGLPVVMTPECNLPNGFAAGAAIRIDPNPESIADGLNKLNSMSDCERSAMGARGRRLVEEKFTWPKVALQMREVYNWVLGGAAKPDFVFEE